MRSLDLSFEILKTFKSESESLWQRVWASGLDDAVWRQERTANQETDADDDDVEEEDDDQHDGDDGGDDDAGYYVATPTS